MLKLLCLNPVMMKAEEDELTYIRKYLHKDTVLLSDGIQAGPYTIQCEYDEAMAQPEIIRLCQKAEAEGVQGIFVNCFGDPGVRAAREVTSIPVFGGFEPVMMVAQGVADRIAIITVLDSVMPLIRNHIRTAGLENRVVCVKNINIPVADLTDHDLLIEALVEQSEKAIIDYDAEVIVLGCTAMIDVAEETEERLHKKGYRIPVLEAAQTGLKMVEMFASMGISHSRKTYISQISKDIE